MHITQALRWCHAKHNQTSVEEESAGGGEGGGGGGHFGDIFLYRIKETAEPVVLKIVRRAYSPKDLEREKNILSYFYHPRIIGFRGTWVAKLPGLPQFQGLVMQRADGNLEAYLLARVGSPEPERWATALKAASQVAEGLQVLRNQPEHSDPTSFLTGAFHAPSSGC